MKLVALALVVVAGAVGAFAVYTFGWHSGRGGAALSRARVITLRDGDVVVRPEAAVRCDASGEAGQPNFFCTRIGGGRHQVIFYKDYVLVWPLDCRTCGPDGPVFTYRWEPKPKGATRP